MYWKFVLLKILKLLSLSCLLCINFIVLAADVGDAGEVTARYDSNEILPVYMGNGIDIQDVAFCADINSQAPQVGDDYTVISPPASIPNQAQISAVLNAVYDGYNLYPAVQQAIWYFSNPGYNPPSSGAQNIINLVNNGTYQPLPDVAWMQPVNPDRQILVGANRPSCSFDLSNATVTPINPTGCTPSYDGQFVFNNLQPNEMYELTYTDNGTNIGPINVTADGSGSVVLSGLDPGNYNNFEITSTSEVVCFQCFIQPAGYDLTYTEAPACPISGPSSTPSTTTAMAPTSATSVNCEAIAATWNSPTNALANDGNIASVTLSQALLGVRASHCLHLTGFNFNVPACAVITGVSMDLGATSTSSESEDRIIQLLNNGSYIGNNQAIGSWPTSGTNSYGGTTNTWGAALTPSLVNSGAFGVIVKTGIDIQLFNNTDVIVGVDYVEMTVHYTLPEVCAEEAVSFSVTNSPDVTNYTWTAPAGAIVESGQGTNAVVIDMNNIAEGCYDVCVDVQFECTGNESCCYTVNVTDCCPELTGVTDTGTDACYTGTPIDVIYTATTDAGTNGTEYNIVWRVDGVEQAGQTGDQFTLSITPDDGCTVVNTPNVTAQLYCNAITDSIGTPMASSSGAYRIYPIPVEGVDYTVVEQDCQVEIVDNCGSLDITNDQGGGAIFTMAEGDPDQTVNFTLRSDANAPVGCETTLGRTVSCITYDLALTKVVDSTVVALGDTVTFTITVYNEGTGTVTGIEVTDTLPSILTYVGYTSTVGTFDGLTWLLGTLAPGDSAVLNVMTTVDDYGVIINEAEISATNEVDIDSAPRNGDPVEDDIAPACVSVPIEECLNQEFSYALTAPGGHTLYEWYKDGVLIAGASDSVYVATEAGSYTYVVDAGVEGSCEAELCCPVIIEVIDCCPAVRCINLNVTKREE